MKRKILAIAGALLIGALGSGLWELIKPLFGWFASVSLDIVTLGLESLRDGLYADAAAQESERISSLILVLLSGIMFGLSFAIFLPWKSIFPSKSEMPKEQTKEALIAYVGNLNTKLYFLKRLKFTVAVILAFVVTTQMLLIQRTIYVSRVTSNFNRICTIISPSITPQQNAVYHSMFSQIRTRAEYIKLVDEIHKIAQQNREYIPPFVIY